jgi:hypothetical protein
VKNAVDSVMSAASDVISFDVEANDRMARRWGSDLISEFSRGMNSQLGTLQRMGPGRDPASFGLPKASPTGGSPTTVNVTVEAGAVQLRGGDTARINADKTAEGVANEFERKFGRRS